MSVIQDLYTQFMQRIDEFEYFPHMAKSHEIFVNFRNDISGELSFSDWDLLEQYLYESEKNWFVVHLLNVLDEVSDRFASVLLNHIVASLCSIDEVKLFLQNLCRIKGFLYVENRLQEFYYVLKVPRTKHQLHKCFYLNNSQIIPRWQTEVGFEECDKTVYIWNGRGYRANLEMFNPSKDFELLVASENALKSRFLLLTDSLINCDFPIQELKFLVSLIPRNLVFDDKKEQFKYLSGIEKVRELENVWQT